MLGFHRLRRALGVSAGQQVVVPHVTAGPHGARRARRPDDDNGRQGGQVIDGIVDGDLDRGCLPLSAGTVGGDQRLRGRHLEPLPHRGRRKAAEDHVVRCTNPGAGQHRHDDLGDHREVDPDHVPLLNAAGLQPVRESLYVGEQLRIGQVALLTLLAVPVEGHPVAVAGLNVPVEAVVGHVERAVGEPPVERRVAVVEHLGERGGPVQPLPGLAGPPGLRVGRCSLIHGGVGDLGLRCELGRRREVRWPGAAVQVALLLGLLAWTLTGSS